jgi:UDPglucose 6-dehydrogenase
VGYGGSCFPKDVKALVTTARELGIEFDLLRAVERTNERQKRSMLDKAVKHFNGEIASCTFAVWGLAFKPRTDDMREAPSVTMIEGLLGKGAKVQCHDPVASHVARRSFGDRVRYTETPYEALEGADALFLLTEWNEFRHPDFDRMKSLLKQPVVFDGRNVFDPAKMRERGFTYYGVGRR